MPTSPSYAPARRVGWPAKRYSIGCSLGSWTSGEPTATPRAETTTTVQLASARRHDGAAGAVAVAIAAALAASGCDRSKLIEEVARYTPPGHTASGVRRAAAFALDADPKLVGEALGTGLDVAAHDTVPFCLWVAARHLDSYEAAIWTATSQDGDRDTLGAIVGGIVVLATGEDAIPFLWRAATEPVPNTLG